jgi:hypothetical protein
MAEVRGQFGDLEKGERPPSVAVATGLVKKQLAEMTLSVCCNELRTV